MIESKLFHQYQLQRPLGGGWLGPVHAATDLDEGREVALRVLDDRHSGQSFLIMQLERLLLKVASVQHPHILPTETLQQREQRAFYAMTLATQGSARQLLQGQARSAQPLPLISAVELVRQAAAGLAYAHSQGLMHGNLKPENVLLQPGRSLLGNAGYTVQLSDFGLAELHAGSHGTHDRAVVNALAYMSPEQCRGVRNELRTDLYALGLILYELITGLVPFEIRDAAEALEKHQHVAPRQPSQLRPGVPEALEEIILVCLAKQPEDRYADAQALEAALQEVLNGMMPGGPEPTVRLPTLPVLPPAPAVPPRPAGSEPRLLVFSERHELLREQALPAAGFTVGRAPGNTVLLEYAGVSRHHLSVEFESGQAYVTELTATNGSVMDGLPLTPMTRLRWPYNTPLYLRPYWLVLSAPETQQARPRIVVKPEVEGLVLVPGVPKVLNLLLANTGRTVDHFRLSLDGIPPEWVQDAHGEVQLNPGTQAPASLTLLAPKVSASRAGEYPCTVLARSREDTSQYGRAALKITVAEFAEVVATLTPPVRRTWRRTSYQFRLENRGNAPATYAPHLRDNEGQLRLIPRLHDLLEVPQTTTTMLTSGAGVNPGQLGQQLGRQAGQQARFAAVQAARNIAQGQGRIRVDALPARMTLEPGAARDETLKVRVPVRWVGVASQHQMVVDVRGVRPLPPATGGSGGGDAETEHALTSTSAELHHTPLIPLWLLPLLLLLLGLLIWWLLRPPMITQFALVGSDPVVRPGQPFRLRWDTQNANRVDILELGPQGHGLPADGSVTAPGIRQDQKYTLVARSLIGRTVESVQTVQARYAAPVIAAFEVSPVRVAGTQPVQIRWQVQGAEEVNISELGKVPASGTRTVTPLKDTTYTLTARNGTESASQAQQVTVLGPQIKSFSLTRGQIERGGSDVLSWNVANAATVSIDPLGTVPAQGQRRVSPDQSTNYVLTAQAGSGAAVTANARLVVNSPAPVITSFTVSPNPVRSDKQITLHWATRNAVGVTVQDGTGAQEGGPSGDLSVNAPPVSSSLVVTARNDQGQQVTKTVALTVIPVDAAAEAAAAAAKQQAAAEAAAQQDEDARKGQVTFTADPLELQGQGDVTLTWDAPGFARVDILPLTGPVNGSFPPTGSTVVKGVNTTRTYTLRLLLRHDKQLRIARTVKVTPLPPAIVSFSASSKTLSAPGPVTLSWEVKNVSVVRLFNVPGPLPSGQWPAKGSTTVNVAKTTAYTLSTGDPKAGGLQATTTVAVNIPAPLLRSFTATPSTLTDTGRVTLAWDVGNASSVRLDGLRGPNPDGSWSPTGSTAVNVSASRSFVLRAGSSAAVLGRQQVSVNRPLPVRVLSFRASSTLLTAPGRVTLFWEVQNVPGVRLSGASGVLPGPLPGGLWPPKGSTAQTVSRSTAFSLSAGNQQNGSQQKQLLVTLKPVTVTPPPQPPTPPVQPPAAVRPKILIFQAIPPTVRPGRPVTLRWNVSNVSSVKISGLDGTFPAVGSTYFTPQDTTSLTLTAGEASRELTVRVLQSGTAVSPYADLVGTWQHPFGTFTIQNVNGRRASGMFTSTSETLPDLPIDITFSGQTMQASSPALDTFKLIAALSLDRKSFDGTYTLRGQQERWCAYRPDHFPVGGCP